MAGDLTLPGTGNDIATDLISGAHYQRVKMSQGADGAAVDVSAAAPLSVVQQDPNDATRQGHMDDLHLAPVIMDITHHQIHEQESYECSTVDTSMGAADTLVLAFKTPPTPTRIHIVVGYASKAAAHIDVLEGPTWDASSGTQKAIFNRYRDFAGTSAILENQGTGSFAASNNMNRNPTNLAGGTIVDDSYNWSDRKTTFEDRGDTEIILKADTQYAIRLTTDDASNAGQIKLSWYEHPDE